MSPKDDSLKLENPLSKLSEKVANFALRTCSSVSKLNFFPDS